MKCQLMGDKEPVEVLHKERLAGRAIADSPSPRFEEILFF